MVTFFEQESTYLESALSFLPSRFKIILRSIPSQTFQTIIGSKKLASCFTYLNNLFFIQGSVLS